MIQDERVMADSRRTEARHRIAVDSAPAHRNMGVAGGVLMLCAAIVLVAAQLSMYPNTRLGEENATFMFFPSAVLALSGLNVVARPAQSHRVAGVLGLVAGVAILVVALANPHQATGTWILELVGGAAGVLGAAPSLSRR
jgi:peptidoglycan/LPS O-acetylase OafA/YrhL